MKNLSKLFLAPIQARNRQPLPNWLIWGILIIALAGFADASFIAVKHWQGEIPPCSVLEGCENVLTSKYSTIGPIRVEWLGMAYYLTIFIISVFYLDSKNMEWLIWAARLSVFGLLASIIFIILQVFVIKSICLYCMFSAATSVILFILGFRVLNLLQTNEI